MRDTIRRKVEAIEELPGLGPAGKFEFNVDVHTARTAESSIKRGVLVGCSIQNPSFLGTNAVKRIEKTT
jgi:hypothetical protein